MGRRKHLLGKTRLLLEEEGVRILNSSSLYRSAPLGFRWQSSFLNQVLETETTLSPYELLEVIHRIERKLGRVRLFPNGPRTIDIDLLFYDNLVMVTAALTLPHPRLHERAFVLIPLAQMAPDLTHPVLGLSVLTMLERVDTGGVELWL